MMMDDETQTPGGDGGTGGDGSTGGGMPAEPTEGGDDSGTPEQPSTL